MDSTVNKSDASTLNPKGQYIWLVGASSGIGLALAKALATGDNCIFVSARNHERLAELAAEYPEHIIPVALDITDDWSVNAAAQKIISISPQLDQVIINAGTCEYIDSNDIDLQAVKRVLDTNFTGALNIVNESLPLLRKRLETGSSLGSPQLVFVSSSVTYQALPRAGAYGASKAALRYFAESLRMDLQHEGIDVRVVSPGFVKTPLTDKNDFPMPFRISAEEAAQRIIKGLRSSRFDIAFPKRFIASLKLLRALPDWLRFKIVGKTSRHASNAEQLNTQECK
jgi:short-subunit dehydrogenase